MYGGRGQRSRERERETERERKVRKEDGPDLDLGLVTVLVYALKGHLAASYYPNLQIFLSFRTCSVHPLGAA